jgi:Tfp pilus assembly protein FimV
VAVRTEELVRPMARRSSRAWSPRSRREARRRRLGTALSLIAIVVGVQLAGGSAPASRGGTPRQVVVREGQTLWAISERYAPPSLDTRAYVDAVIELNDLEGVLHAGQRLRLPR